MSTKWAGEGCSLVLFTTQASGMFTLDLWEAYLPSKAPDILKRVDQHPALAGPTQTDHFSSSSQPVCRLSLSWRLGRWLIGLGDAALRTWLSLPGH